MGVVNASPVGESDAHNDDTIIEVEAGVDTQQPVWNPGLMQSFTLNFLNELAYLECWRCSQGRCT